MDYEIIVSNNLKEIIYRVIQENNWFLVSV